MIKHRERAAAADVAAMDVDRAQVLEQYRAKVREHREIELR